MINLTDKAANEVKKLQERMKAQGKGFRIEIVRGGCHGYSYEFGFDDEQEDDHKSVTNDITVLTRAEVSEMVDGMTIDFENQMAGDIFVFKNPKAASACGCGNSFAM
ncbi:MAG: iron-sulfur cluster assembly accessory protein [Nitrospinota bacterium]|nr:iron-sulfur cluster assembly accessory protein [Nitrospinota bacterium]